jgi:cytochrome c peroxidase
MNTILRYPASWHVGRLHVQYMRLPLWVTLTIFGTIACGLSTAQASDEKPLAVTSLPLGLPRQPTQYNNAAIIAFGQYLFGSSLLSSDGSVACVSCHKPSFGYSDESRVSVGVDGYTGNRRALPLFNLYIFSSYMADGRASDLVHQHIIPLESPEMRVNWSVANSALAMDAAAVKLARLAGVTKFSRDNVVGAIAAFVGTLVSGNSAFDHFYYGGNADALTETQKRGLRIFIRKAHCSSCHLLDGSSAPLTDGGFHSIGVGFSGGAYKDHGRMEVTRKGSDDGVFKTPTLRNVALRTYFMHDGSFRSLRDVVEYYNQGGIHGAPNVDARIQKIHLTPSEEDDLVGFLQSLTGSVVSLHTMPASGLAQDRR